VTTDGHNSYPRAIRSTLGRKVRHRMSVNLTDIFDKPFFSVGAIMIWARVTAWRRVGVGNESPSRAYDGRFLFAAPVR
jgi:hypothetical protein